MGSDEPHSSGSQRRANFNPRSPCGERRHDKTPDNGRDGFQSTLPVRGATFMRSTTILYPTISIHAPRAGSDLPARQPFSSCRYFNPRSPCGERLLRHMLLRLLRAFQSTLPVRGATPTHLQPMYQLCNFNPRSPCGERHCLRYLAFTTLAISIHAPRAGSDATSLLRAPVRAEISIHAPRAGSDVLAHVMV